MKIALFTNGIYPYILGGMQKHSYYLTKYLAQNAIYVDLYHFVPLGQSLSKSLENFTEEELKYINHFCFHPDKPKKYPGHYIVESYNLSKKYYKKFLKNKNVDFVYAQGFSGWYYAKEKSNGVNLPSIGVNFHGLNMFQKAASFKVKLEHLLFRYPVKRVIKLSDYTFSLGGKLTDILNKITNKSENILITPIGVSKDWIVSDIKIKKEFDKRKFVFIGRYERGKGITELSNILKGIENLFNFEFHFIGPIPKDKQIASNKITYHGLIKDENKIKEILRESDILVVPSYSEGMPTVILEAMASGCAIIATDVGAVCEEVDNTNGWLIESGNIIALKNSIINAINYPNNDLLAKKHKSIIKIQEKFIWNNVIIQNISVITECK